MSIIQQSLTVPTTTLNINPSGSEDFSSSQNSFIDLKALDAILKPISYLDLIEESLDKILKSLSNCPICCCMHFDLDEARCWEDALEEARCVFECTSEISDDDSSSNRATEEDLTKLIRAVMISESRKSTEDRKIESYDNDFFYPLKGKRMNKRQKDYENTNSRHTNEVLNTSHTLGKSSLDPFFKFLLPTNFEKLQDISPLTYLEKYCWTCPARYQYYQKELSKLRDIKDNTFTLSKLYHFLNAVMMNTFHSAQFTLLCELLGLNESTNLENTQMFSICAVVERLFYFSNLTMNGEIAMGIAKGYQESLDFQLINKKINDYKIPKTLMALLRAL